MKSTLARAMIILLLLPAPARALTGEEVLRKIDGNLFLDQAVSVSRMTIHRGSRVRTIQSRSWIKGMDKSFVEYLAPAREKGKKMLKLGDKLWTYTPEPTDRVITISGHLLRQSVMGSDLSYEDMMENSNLADVYAARIEGREEVRGRDCHVLTLTAKVRDIAYHSRKIWVDAERWLPLKEERHARRGRLLKTFEILEMFQSGDRWYPRKMIFKDMLLKGKGTEYFVESIDFEVEIPDYKFTKASLRK
ncbi:MAG: outer membrane lipoprotein-sorting protein [Desulfobacterales bacterium]|nr:outer membrane lipoprotein-sorting protein [Desulfobacterales bacterium]